MKISGCRSLVLPSICSWECGGERDREREKDGHPIHFWRRISKVCPNSNIVFSVATDMVKQDLYHVFIDFKKAFDRVWHAALWATMKKYNISSNLIQVIKNLYNKATTAVLFNSSTGDWFWTTVGVRKVCLLSPTLFNLFLERIMTDAL